MDVNDLKALFAEVNKRMAAALEHVKHELGGVRTGRASITILDHVQVEAYGSRMPAQPGGRALGPGAHADRRAAVRSDADRRAREGDPDLGSGLEPRQRRQSGTHSHSVADRGSAQGAVAARPQAGRRGPQHRAAGPARRERSAEETAEGLEDFARTTRRAWTKFRRSPTSTSS